MMHWAVAAVALLPIHGALAMAVQEPASGTEDGSPSLVDLLADELAYSMDHLVQEDGMRPYYLAYTLTDRQDVVVRARLGALQTQDASHDRVVDVDIRVGDYDLDNTHQLRGRGRGRGMGGRGFGGATIVSCEDDADAIRHDLWLATDRAFKNAVERFQQVQTNLKTMVEEESQAADFSREEPGVHLGDLVELEIDLEEWADRLRAVSRLTREYPKIYGSDVSLLGTAENRFLVTSEGTRLRSGRELWRVAVSVSSRAEDGMELGQSHIFDVTSEEGLPSLESLEAAFQEVVDQVLALREAPLVEPYTGPAILRNRASGVFFHEIFGHRIEGHRQKNVEEGQTFTKMIDQPVLPDFLSVTDDPTLARFGGQDLRGHYEFDDEGVAAQAVHLVENGVLKTFLLSRSPVEGFPHSNGHGRREPGRSVVSRQGNLLVESARSVSFDELRAMLIEECKKQGKPFGLLFEDITGGFTTTRRSGPQAFKVLPVVVYRIYPDDRPDELVRGADIVGTPLSCFSRIVCTGDDPAVFNGSCGAESGWVPVSAISPSILVEQIEIEKRQRSQERLPILPSPIGAGESDEEGTR